MPVAKHGDLAALANQVAVLDAVRDESGPGLLLRVGPAFAEGDGG